MEVNGIVERDDIELQQPAEGVDYQAFQTNDEIEVVLGTTVDGNDVVTTAKTFIAVDVERENSEMAQQMGQPEVVDESGVVIANEDGEVGAPLVQVDGGDMDDAIETFEEDYL